MTTVANTTKPCKTINVPITDVILTPATCASLISEVMKNILYHRSQIPYPYTWLKSIIKKKRRVLEETEESPSKNFKLSRHYQIVSAVYDGAEAIMESLVKAFTRYGNQLKEVVFVVGVTPFSPTEIFTIKVSSVSSGHVESNHVTENSKKQQKILRGIFLENTWMSLGESSIACSNTYIFLKLSGNVHYTMDNDSLFILAKPLYSNSRVKHTVICLNYNETEKLLCCDNLEVFKDECDLNTFSTSQCSIIQSDMQTDNEVWLQARTAIKGFKDCFINKISASELW